MEQTTFLILLLSMFTLVFYAVHELSAKSKLMSYILFLIFPAIMLPLILTTEWNGWFNVAKTTTMIFVGAFITVVRFQLRHVVFYAIVACLLPLNIAEAALKDFEVGRMLDFVSGSIVILLLPRLTSARVDRDLARSFVYPTSWSFLIAYNVWHMSFMYRYVSFRGHAGDYVLLNISLLLIPLLIAATRGPARWLQARAYTLAFSILSLIHI